MATLECNSTPASFNNPGGQENGEALPEEKSLSIDYSEDLWLANSEDSSGPYAQHAKGGNYETTSSQASIHNSYPNSVSSSHTGEAVDSSVVSVAGGAGGGVYPVPQHHWGEMPGQNEEEGAHVLQPNATTFLNGAIEQNGMEFHNSSGDEKDFAQLVPAGTYVEAAGGEAQNKTFTAMMPAAALDVNGEELQPGFTTMLNAAGQQQMVFYGSGEDVNTESSHMMAAAAHHQQALTAYNPSSNQMSGVVVDSQDESQASGEDGAGEGNLYVAMDSTDANHQTTQGTDGGEQQQFAVMSPAVLGSQVVDDPNVKSGDGQQVYATSTVSGSHQAISTLPFLQNGAFPPSSFAQFNQSGAAAAISGNSVVQLADGTHHTNDSVELVGEYPNHAIQQPEQYEQEEENSNSQETSDLAAYNIQEQYQEQTSMEDAQQQSGGENNAQVKTFICETCQKSFATARYLKYHRKNHCKRAGSYEGKSEQEEMMGMELKRFSCNICQRPFRVLKCMKVHKKKKHGIIKDFTCPNCAISFETAQALTDHPCQPKSPLPNQEPSTIVIPVSAGTGPGPGTILPPRPVTNPFLSSSKKKKKLRHAKPSCDICGKLFGDRISLDIHRVKHIEEEFYPCDMCPLDIHAEDSTHLAVHFRIKFFTDDNQHILEDQKAAAEAMRTDETLHSPNNSLTPNNSLISQSPSSHHLPSSSTPIYSNPSSIIARAAACTNIINHSHDDGGDGTTTTFIDESGNEYSTVIKSEDFNNSDTTDGQSVMLTPQQQQSRTFYSEYSSSGGEATQVKTPSSVVDDGIPVTKTVLRSKPHMCDICNKSFTEAAKLEIHYKSNHVEDRPFHCEICEKSFFTKWKLQRHMLSHLEIKPHSCPACSKSFVERGKLEAHYRTHLGTKPYKCEYCSKAFTVKSQLTIHVRRIHSADQPFGCEICGKAFLWRSGLEKHMRKHTREKPYCCNFCGQKYSQKSNLISHLAKVHNHQYVEPEQQQQQQQPQQQQQSEQQLDIQQQQQQLEQQQLDQQLEQQYEQQQLEQQQLEQQQQQHQEQQQLPEEQETAE